MVAIVRSVLFEGYVDAKEIVIQEGYGTEVDWQYSVAKMTLSESRFLREAAWVILSAGMRETVVRRLFSDFSRCFMDWSSARAISQRKESCRKRALAVFGHPKKIDGVLAIANEVVSKGFSTIQKDIADVGVEYFERFPYIGPITSYHLAKNLGLDVAKPDRHLVRISQVFGFQCVQEFCREISSYTGDPVAVVDIVLWRFATLTPDYVQWWKLRLTSQ